MNQKIKHWIIIFFLICSIFSGLLVTDITDTAIAVWWDGSWKYSQTITVDHTKIDTNLQNFPLLVVIDSTTGSKCDSGDSIRFLSNDNLNEFYYEIETWNSSGNSFVWVNISETITNTVDYSFMMYYNNSAASDNQTATGVWASNYTMVHHLNASGTETRWDSTSNNNDATRNGDVTSTSGKIGDGNLFNGTVGHNLTVPHDASQQLSEYTISAWIKTDNLVGTKGIIVKGNDAIDCRNYQIYQSTSHYFGIYENDAGTDSDSVDSGVVSTGIWYYVVFSFKNDTGTPTSKIYLNATNTETTTDIFEPKTSQTTGISIGHYNSGGWAAFNGTMDEIHISNIRRNASWIKASYHNQNQTTNFLVWGTETSGQVVAPTNFKATTLNITAINISWTIGTNATHTHVQQKIGSYPTSRSDGTNVYNDTGTFYVATGLTSYTRYYYRAWGYNSTTGNWSSFVSSYNNTGPTNPTSVSGTVTGNDLTISWIKGSYADATTIRRKTNGYPTSPTDGTNIYNSTGLCHIDTNVLQTYYYTLFSWDNNTNLHSSGVYLEWGTLDINCYDENTTDALTFNVFITNDDGSQTYEDAGCTNTHHIDLADLPLGDNVIIQISTNASADVSTVEYFTGYSSDQNGTTTYLQLGHTPVGIIDTNITCYNSTGSTESYPVFLLSGSIVTIYPDMADEFTQINVTYTFSQAQYRSRIYHMDLVVNTMYTLDAYLSNATNLYLLHVVDENNNPIEGVELDIMRHINNTVGFESIAIIFTGANGEVDVYLIPNQLYKIKLSKTGYETKYENYIPDPEYYGLYYPKTFQLIIESEEPTVYTFDGLITFNGTINTTGVITICYYDNSDNTIDTTIFIYENYNGTLIFNHSDSRTGDNDFCFTDAGYNTSRTHDVFLHLNHSNLGYETVTIRIFPFREPTRNESAIEGKFEAVFGEFELGWVKTFIIFFPCMMLLVVFGAAHSGLGIMAAGMYLGFTAFFIDVSHIASYGSLATIIIMIGLTLIVVRKGRKAL